MDVAERGSKIYVKVTNNDDKNEEDIELTVKKHDDYTDNDDHDDESSIQVQGTCADNCACLACLFLVGSVGIGSLSVIFDWLWVADMFQAEKALVFGPPTSGVYISLIIMSCLGTITYICENADKIYKFFTRREIFDEQAEEMLSLFLEEVPEITLNLLLSMCREIPTSYFQLVKAGLAIASSGLRLIKATCYAFGCKKTKQRRHHLRAFGRFFLIAACIYTFATGITVFVFMYMEPKTISLDSRFYAPANVFGEAYNTERYFPNSGVFLAHPSMDQCQQSTMGNINATGHKNWIRIEVMYTYLLLHNQQLEAVYCYNNTHAMFHVKSRRREQHYNIDLSQCIIKPTNDTSCRGYSSANILYLVFHHTPVTETLVFGDIKYSATITMQGQCSFVTGESSGRMYYNTHYLGQLQYFKAPYTVNTTLPVIYNNNDTSTASFYQYPQQLLNVSEAWRTGYKDCKMSGSLAPNPQTLQYPECRTWQQI